MGLFSYLFGERDKGGLERYLSKEPAPEEKQAYRPESTTRTEEDLEEALLSYQTSRMRELGERHKGAYYGGLVYHGCQLAPEEVFARGIPAKGGRCYDIGEHQVEGTADGGSALRGGCLDARTPAKFAGEGSWVYVLAPVGGAIDVNAALGDRRYDAASGRMVGSIMYGETELAFGSMQPPSAIKGAYRVGPYFDGADAHKLGEFVPNPSYAGSR